ncbi:diacylglycerol kinase family lipid kinase [Cellulomonas sp. zg-ZUI222]|uniref:Diacylglycerol kinase family lipid kinase n=1 Tax=Cellulomonas wangleii TaxID=2816956 RepID=A0ABX8CZY1_9CELL|nr:MULTISPECIES: diacylglycerol kinase family protein [Cellulomonas]MBO0900329.1 diacylglycerol kinase family lipid kinase [Cellulomonas sp. zg-ZUI22]MBO0920757.1 diacylglycerol kinase family lipid kinase [Cellulomonas wangleii]MBO0926648.1 diacylglycerol kinase family lipid kinase [Cellulomonas wangleii]QVI60800.1 diacylglycerol kinase family lipid kinase [Cellulomonas wangleii]
MSTVGLVVNPVAGTGQGTRVGRRAHRLLERAGHVVHDLSAPTLAQATHLARQAATVGLDALVVVGGDGMVHLGVDVVAGTDVPLGIVAVGTGNDVARALGLPRADVDRAVAVIDRALRDAPQRVDALRAGPPDGSRGTWCAGVLSCGLDAAVNARANALTWPRGHARYLRALPPELAAFRPYGYRVQVDDVVWESAGTVVAVANTPWFGGGLPIAPDAVPDDGLLDVVLAGPLTRRQALGVFPRIYRGKHVDDPRVQVLRGRRVLVEPAPALGPAPPVAFADGERVDALPLLVEVVPGALGVLR